MDEFKQLLIYVAQNPLWAIVFILLTLQLKLVDKFVLWRKKLSGTIEYPHRRKEDTEDHTHKRFDDVEFAKLKLMVERQADHINRTQQMLGEHLVKEQEEDVRIGIMQTKQEAGEKNQERMEENIEKIFSMITSLKDSLIAMGYGKKGKS